MFSAKDRVERTRERNPLLRAYYSSDEFKEFKRKAEERFERDKASQIYLAEKICDSFCGKCCDLSCLKAQIELMKSVKWQYENAESFPSIHDFRFFIENEFLKKCCGKKYSVFPHNLNIKIYQAKNISDIPIEPMESQSEFKICGFTY